ncbi:MAG: alkaline phosphatase family protein [Gemmatimonadota bacterium]|nr:alkaline phosphatase family protein [Gemmatimonadota bacterium]
MISRLLRLALASAVAAPQIARAQPAAQPAPRTPQLVVFITIDQLLPVYFERYGRQINGGLARLHRNGAFFTNAYQDHAVTETAPGHASTLSGRFPRSTGIVTNALGVGDAQAPIVEGLRGAGASPYRFRGSVLIDWMRVKDARSRALSVSRKDRGAILPIGRAKQEAFWYASDRFVTSTYYADTLPTWVQRFNARRIPQSYAGKRWELLLAPGEYAEVDSVQYEGGRPGHDVVFPHVVTADSAIAPRVFPNYPWMDEHTLNFALEGLQAMNLGRGPQPDLLAISLSTMDAVGHSYGPESREVHDMFLRLDRYLGAFIDSLYRLRDSSTIAFALTADHGVASYPEIAARRQPLTVTRVDLAPAIRPGFAALGAAGVDSGAVRFEEGILFVDRDALVRRGLDPDSAIRAMGDSLHKVPGVQRVDYLRNLRARTPSQLERDYVARRWIQMLPPDLPAELVVTLEPNVYWGGVFYATHGSPHDYDAHVPVIFYGPWFAPGRYRNMVRVVDMAPTLAHVLNVRPTEELNGRVLSQALRK